MQYLLSLKIQAKNMHLKKLAKYDSNILKLIKPYELKIVSRSLSKTFSRYCNLKLFERNKSKLPEEVSDKSSSLI